MERQDKVKRAKRRHKTWSKIQKRLKEVAKTSSCHKIDITGKTYFQKMKDEQHRMSKKHPFDCGVTGCMHCHAEKILRKKKIAEKRKIDFEQQA